VLEDLQIYYQQIIIQENNMFKLHNWVQELIQSFTFYGGGSGGGSSTTSTKLDPTVKPFVQYGLEQAKGLYESNTPQYYGGQTYVSPSAQTQAALQAQQTRALAGNPLLAQGQRQQSDVIGGAYLQNNPYFNQALQGAAQGATQNYNDAIMAAQSGASRAGRYGSNVSADIQNRAASTLANTLSNKYGELAAQNYSNERAMQNAAAQYAPTMAAADYGDIDRLAATGKTAEDYQKTALQADIDRFNYQQNLPYQKLSQYLQSAYGAPTGQVSETTQSGGGKIVCSAMNKKYGFGNFRNAIWLKHSATMPNAKQIEKGYHKLFLPVVAFAFSDKQTFARKIVRKISEHIARHRTADLWKEMRGKKRDPLGRLYRAIIEPICYLAGKV
jgi:hypothetical protein